MSTPNSHCEEIQMMISEALDEQRNLPEIVASHLCGCTECSAFLDFWTKGAGAGLAAPMPPTDLRLREKILSLPRTARNVPAEDKGRFHHYRGIFSAVAAAVVFMGTAYLLLDVIPIKERTRAVDKPGNSLASRVAQHQIRALRTDLRKGASALRGPVSGINRLLD
ncbi:hypothetical protein KBB96_05600 [Luteolibacter ambystomatis]|uniref:Zinc-finger domain-containing protein n=1 Tax=Luteolibacter ambystomatis TaxID=2824561 RepID=A0A975J1N9_9BACT|nr:hypothetical protein [Luteolibacter ambystomatis]QUE52364.1 hypothetical protein KBB96_05600 [Luteolibacter ambystomatis]